MENNNLAGEMANLQAMIGGSNSSNSSSGSTGLTKSNSSSSVNNSNAGFDNNSVVVLTDEDDQDEQDKFNELVGSFDQPKKSTNLTEEDVLLADPNLVPQNNNTQNNANSANSANNINAPGANNIPANDPSQFAGNDPLGTNGVSSGVNSSNSNTGVGNNLPINNNANLPAGNNLAASVMPKGNWNQRFVVIGVCTGILLLTIIFHNTSGKTNPKTNSDEIARALPPPEANPRMADSSLHTYELGLPDGKLPSNKPIKVEDPLPPLTIPSEVAPAPIVKNEPTPTPVVTLKPEIIEEPEDFSIKFRAANKLAAENLLDKNKDKQEAKEAASVLEGLRIPMQLIEPLRSGIPTNVSAVVIADVKDGVGNTVVPKGSRVQIPFLAFEVQGRVSNDIGGNTVIVLPNNKKIAVKGTVKGTDGFAGLKGKVKQQSKGNLLARTGRAIGRIGARVISVETGGVGGFIIEDTINQSVNTSLPFIPTERVVEVMAGTPFTFNIN